MPPFRYGYAGNVGGTVGVSVEIKDGGRVTIPFTSGVEVSGPVQPPSSSREPPVQKHASESLEKPGRG